MRKSIAAFLIVLLFGNCCFGAYQTTAQVQYKNKKGWSEVIQLPVNFMIGNELNELSKTSEFSYYSLYALVEWPSGLTSHVKVETPSSCDQTTDEKCVREQVGNFEGKDLGGKQWSICISDSCIPKFSESLTGTEKPPRKANTEISIPPQTNLAIGLASLLLGVACIGIGYAILKDYDTYIYQKSPLGERTNTLSATGEAMVGFFVAGGVFLAVSPVFFILTGSEAEWSNKHAGNTMRSVPNPPPVYGLNIAGKF